MSLPTRETPEYSTPAGAASPEYAVATPSMDESANFVDNNASGRSWSRYDAPETAYRAAAGATLPDYDETEDEQ